MGAHTERASELVSISIRSDAGRWQHRRSQRPVACSPFSPLLHSRPVRWACVWLLSLTNAVKPYI